MSDIFDKFKLDGRVAVVTGGVGLLGKEFCRTLAQAGADVVVADMNEKGASDLADEIQQTGKKAMGVQVDVTDTASVTEMAQKTVRTFGSLDILVCSAAMDPKFDSESQTKQNNNAFEDYPLEMWKQALDVNLTGMFLCCQAAVHPMLEQNYGVIINICSTYGVVAPDQRLYERPGQPQQYKPAYYPVTKFGVLGLTKYLAAYYAGKNIRVNSLTPHGIYNNHDEVFLKNFNSRSVLGRMAEKDEMNGALLFLASEASSYMTGSNLIVDGGWTVW